MKTDEQLTGIGGRLVLVATGIALVLAAGCNPSAQDSPSLVEREGESPVMVYPPGDRAMDAAIADARRSVDRFILELPRLKAESEYLSVKAPLETDDGTEHIWLENIEFRDGRFHGTLANEPIYADLSFGDPYSVAVGEISDWLAVLEGEMYGGYTVFVARDGLSEAQRAEFSDTLGFRMPSSPKGF